MQYLLLGKIIKETDNGDNLLLSITILFKKTLIGNEKLNSRRYALSLYTSIPKHQYLRCILTNYLKLTA